MTGGKATRLDDQVRPWLLEGDPAVRWRVLAGLTRTAKRDVARERTRIATEGWGARFLAAQNADGGWGGGDYSPKWTSTTYTLLRLAWLGLPPGNPAALRGCERLWEWEARWRTPEACVVGMLIRITCSLGHVAPRLESMVAYLLDQQLNDGGWNCATRTEKDKHSSFHTTILALEALDAYARGGGSIDVTDPARRGREFFLEHHLYRSHRSDAVAIRGSTRFPAFPEWHFDVMRGLEHFAAVDADRDPRLDDAIDVIRGAQRADGRWPTYNQYPGRQFFSIEPPGPSRWNTARALLVLRWYATPNPRLILPLPPLSPVSLPVPPPFSRDHDSAVPPFPVIMTLPSPFPRDHDTRVMITPVWRRLDHDRYGVTERPGLTIESAGHSHRMTSILSRPVWTKGSCSAMRRASSTDPTR